MNQDIELFVEKFYAMVNEMAANMHEKNVSVESVLEYSPDALADNELDAFAYFKHFIHEAWERSACEKGVKNSRYLSSDNPLIVVRDHSENGVAATVLDIINEDTDILQKICEGFGCENPNVQNMADTLLDVMVGALQEYENFSEVAQVVKEMPTHEDLVHGEWNPREVDFIRKFYHSRARTKVLSLEELENMTNADDDSFISPARDDSCDVESQVAAKLELEQIWQSLEENEKKIIQLIGEGQTAQEAADIMGFKSHSSVTKRMKKMRERYKND